MSTPTFIQVPRDRASHARALRPSALNGVEVPPLPYVREVLHDRPVRYYRLNEASGEVAYDHSAEGDADGRYLGEFVPAQAGATEGDHAVRLGAVDPTTGAVEPGWVRSPEPLGTFDGSWTREWTQSDAIHQFSIELWFRPSRLDRLQTLLRRIVPGPWTSRWELLSGYNRRTLTWRHYIHNGTSYQISTSTDVTPLDDDVWCHVVATSQGHLYVNGALIGVAVDGLTPMPRERYYVTEIGGWLLGALIEEESGFVGDLDEFALYLRPLSAHDVARHYQARNQPNTHPLVFHHAATAQAGAIAPSVHVGIGRFLTAPSGRASIGGIVPSIAVGDYVKLSWLQVLIPAAVAPAGATLTPPVAGVSAQLLVAEVSAQRLIVVAAPSATLTLHLQEPTILGGQGTSVAAVSGHAALSMSVPTLSVGISIPATSAAAQTGALAPLASGAVLVEAAPATAQVQGLAPVAALSIARTSVPAQSSVAAPTPTLATTSTATVSAPAARTAVRIRIPYVVAGKYGIISPSPILSLARLRVPVVVAEVYATLSAPALHSRITALPGRVAPVVYAPSARAAMEASPPDVAVTSTVTVAPPAGHLQAQALTPEVSGSCVIAPDAASFGLRLAPPLLQVGVNLAAPAAQATSTLLLPQVVAGQGVDIVVPRLRASASLLLYDVHLGVGVPVPVVSTTISVPATGVATTWSPVVAPDAISAVIRGLPIELYLVAHRVISVRRGRAQISLLAPTFLFTPEEVGDKHVILLGNLRSDAKLGSTSITSQRGNLRSTVHVTDVRDEVLV